MKLTRVSQLTSVMKLDQIKVGDFIEDDLGKFGKVIEVEVISYFAEKHYYFRLAEKQGTILIIK
ncbi:hypothetical protein [Pedobacter mucosus]|uniref:hypothetical protein n=1 Tax=Pedobacter mucosus TaxID=2895286 RepID=UPI001EE46FDA|nr:hypothetical protein [Pedobacter mucosus]UKT63601.1 hypothetical protein LOK61_17755 [Pedobacter mucosus]